MILMEPGFEATAASSPGPPTPASLPSRLQVPGTSLVAGELAELESRLATFGLDAVTPLPDLTAHLVQGGGKRVRPLILFLSARAHGRSTADAMPLACAAELLHSATLLHDDVVDEADKRRGRVVASRRWGNAMAVLAGDYCLARALAEIATAGSLVAVNSLATTVQELAEGEVMQLFHRGQLDLSEETYYAVLDRKTAALIAWCARVGGLLPPEGDRAMDAYGRAMGIAFQIADDILDYQGDAALTGKTVGTDLREGKATLPLIEACRRRPSLRAILDRHAATNDWDEATLATVVRQVLDSGAVDVARAEALRAAAQAQSAVSALAPSPYRDALQDLARFCADRVR